ncbi:hypothetical protein Vadar_007531 [Vaccinium darrowii]|uniref:Uncharacterized protein n=1 Tax=Vaccinium darrowii TaxID=229202 RepID=A0ACB7X855_9ERIC|nr:hypothetical protein Vadar_007531 [Vaccinium darrowii]
MDTRSQEQRRNDEALKQWKDGTDATLKELKDLLLGISLKYDQVAARLAHQDHDDESQSQHHHQSSGSNSVQTHYTKIDFPRFQGDDPSAPANPVNPQFPIKKLTQAEMDSRREKGLCFNCDERLIKLRGCPAAQVLVQWSNSFPKDATWELHTTLKSKFPTFEPCGQGLSQGGGNDTFSTLVPMIHSQLWFQLAALHWLGLLTDPVQVGKKWLQRKRGAGRTPLVSFSNHEEPRRMKEEEEETKPTAKKIHQPTQPPMIDRLQDAQRKEERRRFIAPAKGNCTAEFDSFGSISNVFTLSWSHGMLAEHHRGMCNQHLAGSGSMLFSVICATMYLIWDKDGKTFKKHRHPYEKQQLDAELKLVGEYGLRCKRELWRVQYALSRIRNATRMLLTLDEKNQRRVFEGEALLNENQNKLDYVLALIVENFLERRL